MVPGERDGRSPRAGEEKDGDKLRSSLSEGLNKLEVIKRYRASVRLNMSLFCWCDSLKHEQVIRPA